MTKGQRQQLRDVLEGSEIGAAAAAAAARSTGSGRLQDMQPGVLGNDSGAAAGGGNVARGASGVSPAEVRHRVTSRDFTSAPSAGESGSQNVVPSPLGDGPARGAAHHRATSKISSVMSAMPWHRNKEGGNGAGGTEP